MDQSLILLDIKKKKLRVVTNLFLRVDNVYYQVWEAKMIRLFKIFHII